MLIFLINLQCPKAYQDLIIRYASLNIIENYYYIIHKPKIFTKTRTQSSFRVCDLSSCNILAKNTILLVSELQKTSSSGLEPRAVFVGCGRCYCNLLVETNNFGLGDILLSCLVSKIQKPPWPGFEPRTLFRSFDVSEIHFCFQGISIPSLVQISISVLEL
jgi:hypothetical protein